jgi:hypothetical protein
MRSVEIDYLERRIAVEALDGRRLQAPLSRDFETGISRSSLDLASMEFTLTT